MTPRALGKMLVGNIIVTAAARAPNKVAFFCAGTGAGLLSSKSTRGVTDSLTATIGC